MSSFRWSLKLDTRRPLKGKHKVYPVKLYIYDPRNQRARPIGLNISLTEVQFDAFNQGKTSKPSYLSIGAQDRVRLQEAKGIVENYKLQSKTFDFDYLKRRVLLGRQHDEDSVLDVLMEMTEQFITQGKMKSADSYRSTISHFVNYTNHRTSPPFFISVYNSFNGEGGQDALTKIDSELTNAFKKSRKVGFEIITEQWLLGFQKWRLAQGNSQGTVSVYLRVLRTAYNRAIIQNDNLKSTYPFGQGKFKIASTPASLRAIFIEEVKLLESAEVIGKREEFAKDFWLFSFYGNGMNFKDIAYLKWGDFRKDHKTISFVRKKTMFSSTTNQRIDVGVNDSLELIIEKWSSTIKSKRAYIFPFLDGVHDEREVKKIIENKLDYINKGLGTICSRIGLEPITYQAARHSFSVVSIYQNDTNILQLMVALGHSSLSTTQSYLQRLPRKDLVPKSVSLEQLVKS